MNQRATVDVAAVEGMLDRLIDPQHLQTAQRRAAEEVARNVRITGVPRDTGRLADSLNPPGVRLTERGAVLTTDVPYAAPVFRGSTRGKPRSHTAAARPPTVTITGTSFGEVVLREIFA